MKIIGVGFLLFTNLSGVKKFLVIRELNSKPQYHKKRGMLSFPLETFQSQDESYYRTTERLIQEEIGIQRELAVISGVFYDGFFLIPGRPDVMTVYGYGLFCGNPCSEFNPSDSDIEIVGWMTPQELLAQSHLRIEVRPILAHYLANHAY